MTDTNYLYEYFLANSPKEEKSEEEDAEETEAEASNQ